jgi:hypothetical protein
MYLSALKILQNNSYENDNLQELGVGDIEDVLKSWRRKHGL